MLIVVSFSLMIKNKCKKDKNKEYENNYSSDFSMSKKEYKILII